MPSMIATANRHRKRENNPLLPLLHFVGSYPLLLGLVAQSIVLLSSRKDKDRKAIIQSMLLLGALALILGSVLLRPKSKPNLPADSLACVGAVFLLTPGVEALLKLRHYEVKKANGEATETAR